MEPPFSRTFPDDFRHFSQNLDGKVRSRHHAEYASWHCKASWNGRRFERYPEYIVHAASVADVVKTIDFARSHGIGIGVKGSGHSYSGCFLHCSGILLDLSLLDGLEIDTQRGLAMAGPGVTSAQLSRSLAAHDMGFPTGHGGGVGLSGFLLGGGLGINCDAWGGMSTFNIQAVDVVTAGGRILHADENRNAEFLWAARGGGPCLFFAVTRFHLKCWPAPAMILARNYRFYREDLPSLAGALAGRAGDNRLQTMIALGGDDDSACSLTATAFCSGPDEARALHADLFSTVSAWTGDAFDEQRLADFEAIYRQTDGIMVSKRYRADNIMTDEPEDTSRILAEHFARRPSRSTFALLIPRPAHAYPDAAFSVRGKFFVSTYAQWDDERDDEPNRNWLATLYDRLQPLSTGSYINEIDLEERPGSVSRCYAAANWNRLRQLRERHDPHGVFLGIPKRISLRPEPRVCDTDPA